MDDQAQSAAEPAENDSPPALDAVDALFDELAYETTQVRRQLGIVAPEELANALGVKPSRLEVWRGSGLGPRFVKAGKSVFYRLEDVRTWIEKCVADPAPKAA